MRGIIVNELFIDVLCVMLLMICVKVHVLLD